MGQLLVGLSGLGRLENHASVSLGHVGALTGWVGYGWSEPIAYSYGENVYYEGDSVYYGDQVVASGEEYAQQAEQIIIRRRKSLLRTPIGCRWVCLR